MQRINALVRSSHTSQMVYDGDHGHCKGTFGCESPTAEVCRAFPRSRFTFLLEDSLVATALYWDFGVQTSTTSALRLYIRLRGPFSLRGSIKRSSAVVKIPGISDSIRFQASMIDQQVQAHASVLFSAHCWSRRTAVH